MSKEAGIRRWSRTAATSASAWPRRSAGVGGSGASRRSTGSAVKSASDNNVAVRPAIPLAKALYYFLGRIVHIRSMAELVTLPRGPDWRMPSAMAWEGDGDADASPNLIAERDANPPPPRARRALVFDSGLGGLSVLAEIRRL